MLIIKAVVVTGSVFFAKVMPEIAVVCNQRKVVFWKELGHQGGG